MDNGKINRVLRIYSMLLEGKTVNKAQTAELFGVDERSIQRDINELKTFFANRKAECGDNREIVYNREKKGFLLVGDAGSMMDNSEILAVSKILIESRAFSKNELKEIIDKMICGCVPRTNMKLVSELVSNEMFHYVELHNKSHIKDKLWNLGEEINGCNLLEIEYKRIGDKKESVTRVIKPVSLLFSEYYFYLNAYITERDEKGVYRQKYEYPAIFRIDRILNYRETGEKFRIEYASRFEEGQFRKRIQFMYPGELVKLQIRFTGPNAEAILDRLPTAEIVGEDDKGTIIEAEVYGKGVLMWLLTQGKNVEVIRPKSYREEMQKTLEDMLSLYREG